MGRSLAVALAAIVFIVIALSGALLVSSSSSLLPADVVELRPGDVLPRRLKAGTTDSFTIRLQSRDFLRVVVEQQGVDVVVSLVDPEGRKLFETDRQNGAFRPEPVEVVSAATGWHRLQVRALRGGASGRYAVRFEELRPAGPKDSSRAEAARAFAEGEALWRTGDLDKVRAAYLRALRFSQEARDTRGIADAQARLGEVADEAGDLDGARRLYAEAVERYRRLGDPEEARLLNALGTIHRLSAEPREAEKAHLEALRVARGHDDQLLLGRSLNDLGVLYASEAAPRKALDAYDRALEVWRSLGDRIQEARTLHELGATYTVLGRLPQAQDLLKQALRLWQGARDRRGEAATLTELAWIDTLEGNFSEALLLYDEAISLQRAMGNERGEAAALDRRGTMLARMGRTAEALDSYSRALRMIRRLGGTGREAPTLANIGWLYMASGDPRKGELLLEQALPLLRRSSDRHGEAHTLLGLAQAARQRGDLALARVRVEAAIALVELLRREAPGTELRVSYGAQRYGYYELWIDLLMEIHRRDPEAGFDIQALEASERGRGQGLLESLGRENAAAGAPAPERARPLEARIRKLESLRFHLISGGAPAERIEEVEQRLGPLLLERDRLQAAPPAGDRDALRPAFRELRHLLGDDTLLLEYAVGEEKSFLWLLGADGLESWILPGRAELAAQIRRVHERLSRRSQRASRGIAEKAAAVLGQTLLGPLADRLGDKLLLIVPDGPLHDVPFAALPVRPEGPPLLAEHEIVLAPSASTIAVLRRNEARRPPATGDLALIADPVFSADDPRLRGSTASASGPRVALRGGERILSRLPQTRREGESILLFLPPSARQVAAFDFAADREAVLDGLLAEYRIIHFATHAILDPEQPEQSSLVLSLVDASGSPRDGFLRAYEIRDLDLSADLVVLSACSTGIGRELRGEGPLGLSRAFLDAGASRVVVSLWDVEDKPTAELMRRFYQAYLGEGLSPARALRQAQLSLSREPRWSAPYYWSGFVLVGDWR